MNILLVNHYAGSPELGMEYRPYYMSKSVSDLGHSMFILAADQSHLRKSVPAAGYQSIDEVEYLWLGSKPYNGNGFSRVLNLFSFLIEAIKKASEIIKWSTPDVIVASSTYPLDNYLAHYLAKKCGAKVVYEVHDLWPLSPMEIGKISKWHPFMMLLQAAENYAYKNANQVISMLPNTLEYMAQHGLDKDKYHYIPNGIYLADEVSALPLPAEHITLLTALRLQGKTLVGYAGGHAKSNALHKLIESAKSLPELDFVLVGDGIEKKILQQQASSLENVHFLPAIHKRQVPTFLDECDILTLVWNESPLYRFGVSPNKVFDYMLARKPIVQLLNTEHEPVSKAKAGITVSNMNELVDAFQKMMALSSSERDVIGENGYRYVREHHSYSKLAEKFIKVCEK